MHLIETEGDRFRLVHEKQRLVERTARPSEQVDGVLRSASRRITRPSRSLKQFGN